HLQRETDEAEVDEVEADDEEVIDGIGERSVSRKHVDKEEDAIPVERPPDPDCEQDADGQVDEVGGDEGVHRPPDIFERVQLCVLTKILSSEFLGRAGLAERGMPAHLVYNSSEG